MTNMYFRDFLIKHPEVMKDRYSLSFTKDNIPDEAVETFRTSGVIMLRDVIPNEVIVSCREVFSEFIKSINEKTNANQGPNPLDWLAYDAPPSELWDNGETTEGSYHLPWVVHHNGQFPTAMALSALLRSWAWPLIEQICGSTEIVVMFGMCVARHRFDQDLMIGVHQDVTAVNPDVPISIWMPLGEVEPGQTSGLGFKVPAPSGPLPANSSNDIGADYVLNNIKNIWLPHYRPGDMTIHSRYSPHFTTGYCTNAERYSLEIRLWAKDDNLVKYYDPSIWIDRCKGVPVIVGTKGSVNTGACGFLAHAALLAMQTPPKINSVMVSEPRPKFASTVFGAIKSMLR